MNKRGRPSIKTDAICKEILDRLSQGEPLADICRDDNMPACSTVSDWKAVDEGFSVGFARARSIGYDAIATRVRHTARGTGESTGDVQRDKLIIETDLKLLAKWDAKRYGDKLTVDGNQVMTHKYDLDSLEAARLDELERILADASRGKGSAGEAEPSSVH